MNDGLRDSLPHRVRVYVLTRPMVHVTLKLSFPLALTLSYFYTVEQLGMFVGSYVYALACAVVLVIGGKL